MDGSSYEPNIRNYGPSILETRSRVVAGISGLVVVRWKLRCGGASNPGFQAKSRSEEGTRRLAQDKQQHHQDCQVKSGDFDLDQASVACLKNAMNQQNVQQTPTSWNMSMGRFLMVFLLL